MIHLDGVTFVTASEAPRYLGVRPDRVRDWKRRRLVTGYRVGRSTYYRLDELTEVEFITRTSPRGRSRCDA